MMIPPQLVFYFVAITLATSFQFGYQIGVMNAPLNVCQYVLYTIVKNIQNFITNVTSSRYGWTNGKYSEIIVSICVSALLVGGTIGCFLGGCFSNKYGRYVFLYLS